VQRPVVQILVVVATIQARTLKADVEKGFSRTVLGRELIDPKPEAAVSKRSGRVPHPRTRVATAKAKGNRDQGSRIWSRTEGGDADELGDDGRRPGKSCLFRLTGRPTPESCRTAMGWHRPGRALRPPERPERDGRPLKTRGSPDTLPLPSLPRCGRGGSGPDPGRTVHRSRSPRFEASGA
jgi:hypothetical protein